MTLRGLHRPSLTRLVGLCVCTVAAALLFGCGRSISGEYTGDKASFFEKLVFKSGGKVEISFMGGTEEAGFEVEGDKVKITNAGQTQILTIDSNGCLNGGGIVGKYCKS